MPRFPCSTTPGTRYALGSTVFSKAQGMEIAERLRAGMTDINGVISFAGIPTLPFGGVGPSGTGGYHGKHSFDTFSHRRSVLSKPVKPDPSIAYPPYKSWKQRILRRVM